MIVSKKLAKILEQENISITDIEGLTINEFIDTFKDSPNLSLRTASQKMDQYYNQNIERSLIVNILEESGELTKNKLKYNIQVYRAFCIILGIIDRYSADGECFYIPIEYLAKCAETSVRTAKKAINTTIKHNIVQFIGYDKTHSDFAMCKFKLIDREKLVRWIEYGKSLHKIEYQEEQINNAMKTNTQSMIKYGEEKKIKQSLQAMKECPYLIKAFNESNVYSGDFKQKFLLDGRLRASSRFTLTKNPDNHPDTDITLFERYKLLEQLQATTKSDKYTEYDISASIYTLSYYLKNDDFPSQNFYDLFTIQLKAKYGNNKHTPLKNDIVLRNKIKTFCMKIYMHGYNPISKGSYIGVCKRLLLEGNTLYNNTVLKEIDYIDELYQYITGYSIDKSIDVKAEYIQFYQNAYDIMKDLCIIKRSKIFLYETLLCSFLISMGTERGIQIVNAYDGFYMPNNFVNIFKTELLPQAYKQVKDIYTEYMNKKPSIKNKELLDYLTTIGVVYEQNNRKYIKIQDTYIDFYSNKLTQLI